MEEGVRHMEDKYYKICPKCGIISLTENTCTECKNSMIQTQYSIFNNVYTETVKECFEIMYNEYCYESNVFKRELFDKSKSINEDNIVNLVNEGQGNAIICPRCGWTSDSGYDHVDHKPIKNCRYCGHDVVTTKYSDYDYIYTYDLYQHTDPQRSKDFLNKMLNEYCYNNPEFSDLAYHKRLEDEEEETRKALEHIHELGRESNQTNSTYAPHCPTCGSPHIQKISLASKAAGGAMFGLFSKKIRKTFKCNDCGYMW